MRTNILLIHNIMNSFTKNISENNFYQKLLLFKTSYFSKGLLEILRRKPPSIFATIPTQLTY